MDKKIMIGGAVLAGAAFWFYVKPNYVDPKPPPPALTAEQIEAGPRPTVYVGRTLGEEGHAPVDSGVVFNLKAPGANPSYAKVVMAMEFEDPEHAFVGLKGHALEAKNAVFSEELQPHMYRVMDAMTRIIGSRTADEVSSVDGREQLKADLLAAINHELHEERVVKLYFVNFITQ